MKRIFRAKIHKFFLLKKLFARIKREKKLFETAEWLKNCVLAYQNGTPPPHGRKIMVRPLHKQSFFLL